MRSHHSTATIAIIYFLITLLCLVFFTNATKNESTKISSALDNTITQNKPPFNTIKRKRKNQTKQHTDKESSISFHFQSCSNKILSIIFNELLTIREILTLRKTCKDFQIILLPNGKNMVTFCNKFGSKEMDDIPLMWSDLKYFLNQSYKNVFDPMEMFNINENKYAVLTRGHDEQIIFWCNDQIPDPKILMHKTKNEIKMKQNSHLYIQKIRNQQGNAWAEITHEGNVETYGNVWSGGDSSSVQSQLKNVKAIVSTMSSFAALLENGNVVIWGDEYLDREGEISLEIGTQLHENVKMIFSTKHAFTALFNDGNVISWGKEDFGGKIPALIQTKLYKNVKMIVSTYGAFAALLKNGDVVAWGHSSFGGEMQTQLQNVKKIFSTKYTFAALLENSEVIAWGEEYFGGKIPEEIQTQLKNIQSIFTTYQAFAALLHGGRVITWGNKYYGGEIPYEIKNVNMIFSTGYAFAALLKDKSVIAWGDSLNGGNIPNEMQAKLKDIKMIFSTDSAFAALSYDGSVFTWGNSNDGGIIQEDNENDNHSTRKLNFVRKSSKRESKLITNVKTIFPRRMGFTALYNNGETISWGKISYSTQTI